VEIERKNVGFFPHSPRLML